MGVATFPSSGITTYSYIVPTGPVAADSFERESSTTIQNPDISVKTINGPFPPGTYRIPQQYYIQWVGSFTWTTTSYANQAQYSDRYPIGYMSNVGNYYINLTTTVSSFKAYSSAVYASIPVSLSSNQWQIQYLDGKFWLTSIGGALKTSTDGITWSAEGNIFLGYPYIRFGSGETNKYLAFNGYLQETLIATSTDGNTWTSRSIPESLYVTDVMHDGSTYFLCGYNSASGFPRIFSSTDAVTWTQRYAVGAQGRFRKLLYGAGETRPYVAYGDNTSHRLASSTDGITWATATAPIDYTAGIGGIYENGSYYIYGQNNVHITSTDGLTWSSAGFTNHPENLTIYNFNKLNTNEYVFSQNWGGGAGIYFTTSLTNFSNIYRLPIQEGRIVQPESAYTQAVAFNGATYKYWFTNYNTTSNIWATINPKGFFSNLSVSDTPFIFERISRQAIIE